MDSFVSAPSFDPAHLKGSTLILPSVSIGNVPQLTVDLFVHTLGWERVGFVDNDTVMAVCGAREGGPGVSVPIEVFQSTDRQWTLIQRRTPTLPGRRAEYVEKMAAFIAQHEFSQVVQLTTVDAALRFDAQISSTPFRVLSEKESDNGLTELAISSGIPGLEKERSPEEKWDKLPGAGSALPLHKRLSEKVPTTTVIMFALEGDNRQDAFDFADKMDTLLKLRANDGQDWTPPKSWEHLFGAPFNPEMYQ